MSIKTRAVRFYGKDDLRLEEYELPKIKDTEILAKVVCDSICMSTYKAVKQGTAHKRVPSDIDKNPVIVGHELAGIIVEVGEKWKNDYKPGDKFALQPAFNYKGSMKSPGYSYPNCGGDATYIIIPEEAMLTGSLLKFKSKAFFHGALAEPISCVIGTFHSFYHTKTGVYKHDMGILEGGRMAILGGAGPMGIAAIDYALHGDRRPSLLVVTDINEKRIEYAKRVFPESEAKKCGIELVILNTSEMKSNNELLSYTDGKGFDDVLVMAPVKSLVEQGDSILGKDGCLSFFAGPTDKTFSASVNFYNIHYNATHIMGVTGGNTDDMREALELMDSGRINPAAMITEVGGLDSVAETTMNLPSLSGGKKLIYTEINMPLTAISDFKKLGRENKAYKELADIIDKNNGFWCYEAEKYLLENFKV